MTPDLFWISGTWRGRLAITSRPRGGDWLADEARGLRSAGVDVVVSLLEPDEAVQLGLAGEAAALDKTGLGFVSFPIPDRGVPVTRQAVALAGNLVAALEAGKNIAIHCRQSVGRSGLIASAVLVASGVEPERAIELVSQARGQVIPDTQDQRAWILELPAGAALSL